MELDKADLLLMNKELDELKNHYVVGKMASSFAEIVYPRLARMIESSDVIQSKEKQNG